MKPADWYDYEIARGTLPARIHDDNLGRTLDWSDTLRGYYFFGTGEVVRAGFVRRHQHRFQPVTTTTEKESKPIRHVHLPKCHVKINPVTG